MLSLLICLPLQLSLPPAADLSAPPAEPSALHYFMPSCLHFTADLPAAATNVAAYLLISLRHLQNHLRHLFSADSSAYPC